MINSIDLQKIIDIVGIMFAISFPISLVLSLTAKITNFFLSFVFGRKEINL